MVPSGSAISAAAISAMPDSYLSNGSAVLRSRFRFEAVPLDRYREFVSDASKHLVYAVEVGRRLLSTS